MVTILIILGCSFGAVCLLILIAAIIVGARSSDEMNKILDKEERYYKKEMKK